MFLATNSNLLRLEFCVIFYPHFSVLKNAFPEYTQVFLFCRFFCRIFKTREEYAFPSNPSVEGTVNSTEQKTRVFFVKLVSKNSISGLSIPPLLQYVYNWGWQAKRVLSNHLRSLVVEEGGRDVGLIHNQVFKK
jgi:hypothetical protein